MLRAHDFRSEDSKVEHLCMYGLIKSSGFRLAKT